MDALLAIDVLEHQCDPGRFFSATARVLRSGGTMIPGVPFLYWIHETPRDHHRHTRFNSDKWSADHVLRMVRLSEYGGPVAVLFDLVGKTIPAGPATHALRSLARRTIRWAPVRRVDSLRSATYPPGYGLVARKPS